MPDGSYNGAADASGNVPGNTPHDDVGLFDRLPPEILGSLTVRQRNAIADAARARPWRTHPVNIRVSIPLLPRRWYFTLVAGPERRAAERRRTERAQNPVATAGNVAFVLLTATLFYGIIVAAVLFSSSVVEY